MDDFLAIASHIVVCLIVIFLLGMFIERNDGKKMYYHAILYIDGSDQPINAVAEMTYYHDGTCFDALHLPYYFVEEDCLRWDRDTDELKFYMGDNGIKAVAKILDEARESDVEAVASSVVSKSGSYVASSNSEIYHIDSCKYAKNIKDHNMLRFDTASQSEAFGRIACEECLG